MVGNLNLQQISESQDNKEAAINAATLKMDKAMTDFSEQNVTAGNVTVSTTDWENSVLFRVINATVAGRTVTVLARKRLPTI